jgi:hypothetical protein
MVVSDVGDALLLQMDALEVPYEGCMCSGLVIMLCFLLQTMEYVEQELFAKAYHSPM